MSMWNMVIPMNHELKKLFHANNQEIISSIIVV